MQFGNSHFAFAHEKISLIGDHMESLFVFHKVSLLCEASSYEHTVSRLVENECEVNLFSLKKL